MRKIRKPAFTLVELIIVIAIIGVLFAMLIPTVSSAWAVASMAKCQVNLNRMWQAQILRRSDKDQTLFTSGGVWPAMLAPYLERSSDVFHCPEGPERPDLMPMVTTEADLYDTVGGNNEAQQNAPAPNNQTQGFALSDLTFRMYSRHWAGYTDGQYLGTAVADSTVGVKREDLGGGKISLGIDDRSFFSDHSVDAGNLDYRDIRIVVLLQDNRLKQIEFVGSDNGTGSSYVAFKFEVWLADEMISDDFYRDVGMVVGTDSNTGGAGGTGSGGSSGTANNSAGSLNELAAIKAFDYGLNKGTYRVFDRNVLNVDPRLILILDYGKSVANYSNKGPDPWPLYFTAPAELWMANPRNVSFLKPGEDWLQYVALRHFGKANVLFCDGHIELLSADDLIETSTLWGAGAY